MDAGNFSQSRVILEDVLQKDSTNYDAWYEYAYSFVKWYNPNPIVITEATYFSRTKVLN